VVTVDHRLVDLQVWVFVLSLVSIHPPRPPQSRSRVQWHLRCRAAGRVLRVERCRVQKQ
jgi:hypothetical protein